MSNEAVYGFIAKVDQDSVLRSIVADAFASNSDLNLVHLAAEHGFAFTQEEGLGVMAEIRKGGELSDAMLELVAGGAPVNCNTNEKNV